MFASPDIISIFASCCKVYPPSMTLISSPDLEFDAIVLSCVLCYLTSFLSTNLFRGFTYSEASLIQRLHLFRGFTYSEASLIQRLRLFRGFTYSEASLIQRLCLFRGFTYSEASLIQRLHLFRGFTYSEASLIQRLHLVRGFCQQPSEVLMKLLGKNVSSLSDPPRIQWGFILWCFKAHCLEQWVEPTRCIGVLI